MGTKRMLVVAAVVSLALNSGCTSSDDDEQPVAGAGGTSGSGATGSGATGSGATGSGATGSGKGGTGTGAAGSGGTGGGAGGSGGGDPTTENIFINMIRTDAEGACLPRELPVDQMAGSESFGQVPCWILEATFEAPCSCDAAGRSIADASLQEPVLNTLKATQTCGGASGQSCEPLCLCELQQFSGAELARCQTELDPTDLTGFCYVDENLEFVNPELVAECPMTFRRRLRFLVADTETPNLDATTFIACPSLPL